MDHIEARRVLASETDPILRYDAHKVLATPKPLLPPERERKLDTALPIDWQQVIDTRIAAEREWTKAVLIEIIAELKHEAADELERATRNLTAELADLKATLDELRMVLASDRTKPLDLPRLRPRVN